MPSPLDAIGWMVDFFGSYAEAREAIRERNLRSGVAIGIAAYLVIPRWEWAQFAHTVVSRDVITERSSARPASRRTPSTRAWSAGSSSTSAIPRSMADRLRQRAFDSVLREGRTVGRYVGDDVWSFDRDDVHTFAGVLMPTADWLLAEADRRRRAREAAERERKAAERLRQQQKRWSAPPIGADKW